MAKYLEKYAKFMAFGQKWRIMGLPPLIQQTINGLPLTGLGIGLTVKLRSVKVQVRSGSGLVQYRAQI